MPVKRGGITGINSSRSEFNNIGDQFGGTQNRGNINYQHDSYQRNFNDVNKSNHHLQQYTSGNHSKISRPNSSGQAFYGNQLQPSNQSQIIRQEDIRKSVPQPVARRLQMSSQIVQRRSSPYKLHIIWTCLLSLEKRCMTKKIDQLLASLSTKFNCDPKAMKSEIELAKKDGLLVEDRNGNIHIPDEDNMPLSYDTGHDYYCYTCHGGGEVIPCKRCWRVFHSDCEKELINQTCITCQELNTDKPQPPIRGKTPDIVQINKLLGFVCKRIGQMESEIKKCLPNHEPTRENVLKRALLFNHGLNMSYMEKKIAKMLYKTILEFEIDVKTLVHNVMVLYGKSSANGKAASNSLERAMIETNFIRDCIDCYLCYYEKSLHNKNFFTLPCDPVHELVYAKMGNQPHWPAKVLRRTQTTCHVKFFGDAHATSCVPNDDVLPITVAIPEPRTEPLRKAMQEFHNHRGVLHSYGLAAPAAREQKPMPLKIVSNEPLYSSNFNRNYDTDLEENESEEYEIKPQVAVRGRGTRSRGRPLGSRSRGGGRGSRGGARGGIVSSPKSVRGGRGRGASRGVKTPMPMSDQRVTIVEVNGRSIAISESSVPTNFKKQTIQKRYEETITTIEKKERVEQITRMVPNNSKRNEDTSYKTMPVAYSSSTTLVNEANHQFPTHLQTQRVNSNLPLKKRPTIDSLPTASTASGPGGDHAYSSINNKRPFSQEYDHNRDPSIEDLIQLPDIDVTPNGKKRQKLEKRDFDCFVRRSDRVKSKTNRYIEQVAGSLMSGHEYYDSEIYDLDTVSPTRSQERNASPPSSHKGGRHGYVGQSPRDPRLIKMEQLEGNSLRGRGSQGRRLGRPPGRGRGRGARSLAGELVKAEHMISELDDYASGNHRSSNTTNSFTTQRFDRSFSSFAVKKTESNQNFANGANYSYNNGDRKPAIRSHPNGSPFARSSLPGPSNVYGQTDFNQQRRPSYDYFVSKPRNLEVSDVTKLHTENDRLRAYIDELRDDFEVQIRETKRKQWCIVCMNQAVYYCCWLTSYCTKQCQDRHWYSHKTSCRNKNSALANPRDGTNLTTA